MTRKITAADLLAGRARPVLRGGYYQVERVAKGQQRMAFPVGKKGDGQ